MFPGEIVHQGGNVAKGLLGPVVAVSAIAGSARTAFKAYTRVPEGHMALKTWKTKARHSSTQEGELGKLYGVVGPGGTWMFPYLGGRTIIDVRERRSHVGAIQAVNQGDQIVIDSAAAWKVSKADPEHLYRAHYNVTDGEALEQSVIAVCVGGLQTIAQRESRETLLDCRKMTGFLNEECGKHLLDNYGVVLNQIVLREATETAAEKDYKGKKAIAEAITSLSPLAEWLNEFPIPGPRIAPHLAAGNG